jgi:hypothetical protein
MAPVLCEPPPPVESGLANLVAAIREALAPPDDDGRDWILASEAVAQLPFLNGLKGLYRFAADNPGKLRTRPHPRHSRRRQVHAADVLRLAAEHERREAEALDSPAADALPSLDGLRKLADRLAAERARKRR